MDERRWQQFLSFVERARSKPTFDTEEREYRLQIADELRQALAAPPDATLVEALDEVFERTRAGSSYDLTDARENTWLRGWAHAPGSSLAAVLHGFSDSAEDPVERFERFARAAEEAGVAGNAGAVLSFGSLFNFVCDPGLLPVVKAVEFDRVEYTLGYRVSAGAPVSEQYARHLAFGREVLHRSQAAGIPVRDMLDVAGLILLAFAAEDFWALDCSFAPTPSSQDGARRTSQSVFAPREDAPYLSLCAIYRDEAPYLREWVEFHRLVGVERFFLYDNDSADEHREVLAQYVDDGTVVLHPWPVFSGRRNQYHRQGSVLNPQTAAYEDCLRWHRRDSRWIAFIDVDEFLFSPTGEPLSQVLREYERWPGVVANWATFYSDGHVTAPPGPVIGNYRRRVNVPKNQLVKSIVQPAVTVRCRSAHHFLYTGLSAVDENHYPVPGARTKSVSFSRLRINHYYTKSEEEFIRKTVNAKAGGVTRPSFDPAELREIEERLGEADDSILTYLRPLEEALGMPSASAAARRGRTTS